MPLHPKGHSRWHWQFLLILGKSYKSFEFRKDNIILALPEEHEKQEEYEVFMERKDEMIRKYYQR